MNTWMKHRADNSEANAAGGDALDFVADLLAEEELERLAKLSPEELRAEMARRGFDPKRVSELVERVQTEAAGAGEAAVRNR